MNSLAAMAAAFFCCIGASLLQAHEVRPAYLEINESRPGTYSVYWKVPHKAGFQLAIDPIFPAEFKPTAHATKSLESDAVIAQWIVASESNSSLAGHALKIDGLDSTLTDVLVRVGFLDGKKVTVRLTASNPEFTVPESPTIWMVAWTYFVIGVEHIIFGIDHLLFVLALLLIVSDPWKLVKTVTAFTIAHSLTLILATLDLFKLPGPPVEALIALSIVLVAHEVIRKLQGNESMTERNPWLVAFAFGLLHGFGFAGALSEVGLPPGDIPMALLTFNLGVEAGQLMFILIVVLLVKATISVYTKATNSDPNDLPEWISIWPRVVVTYGIGVLAAFWFVERVIGFLVA